MLEGSGDFNGFKDDKPESLEVAFLGASVHFGIGPRIK